MICWGFTFVKKGPITSFLKLSLCSNLLKLESALSIEYMHQKSSNAAEVIQPEM